MTTTELTAATLTQLQQEINRLQRENDDLHIALTTIAEHGDMIESLLNETNVKLRSEILERQRAEAKLQNILSLISREKEDLEIIVETIMQHGDVVDAQWRQKLGETAELLNLDSLTQVSNRRHFDLHLAQQWERAMDSQEAIALILCDIDHFKQFNDFYGHLSGDDCLRRIAKTLSATLRNPFDLFARYGGEEFGVILPQVTSEAAQQIAKRMQASLTMLEIPHHHSPTSEFVTMSFGIGRLYPQPGQLPLDLIAQADENLYKAKRQGRNCIFGH
ncbi:PleD gene product [Synechocystis sp. PCC 6803]|jgi:diguanylate cyclase (GGDEF)-like protein|uniref:PleD gene product n=1 Tax=Synechocystis sp. (strain ATCC 27184 / PCC 6803 / Kazusa) TaxID=1111708 RepID=P74658_SYNY3|nr:MULTISPECIES: diguanylate cyclase [unclassified Synechocystis]BAM53353.1 PleD gene product [Synechocystis sp. PCC 6803] [Bacillus subtilis BEST7613]AGF53325.1 PleD [Synechocystis sp. PCC 6803]ALJ69194.1 diguanylate cyclase [Synechocystis sp. PCC 6803]AVP91061.1 GGDEF domain-containing protein [Synechocystis sp. IPPAS B-1465]MBD2618188.1 GGDEF domain-containing protein [Synechocystis sp. FACHB-898]